MQGAGGGRRKLGTRLRGCDNLPSPQSPQDLPEHPLCELVQLRGRAVLHGMRNVERGAIEADGAALLAETLAVFAERFQELARGDSIGVLSRWRELAPSSRGATVEWDTARGAITGTAAGIDDDGALLVRVGGRTERIISGEVRWK